MSCIRLTNTRIVTVSAHSFYLSPKDAASWPQPPTDTQRSVCNSLLWFRCLPLLNILYAPAQVPRSHLRSETESCTICEKYSPHPTTMPLHTCDWLHSLYGCKRLLIHQDCTLDELTSFTVPHFNSHSCVYLQGGSQKHTRWQRDAVVSAVTSQKHIVGLIL